MSALVINDVDEQIYLLNMMELGATVFRGPDAGEWARLIETGLPILADLSLKRSGHLTTTLLKLQGAASSDDRAGLVNELLTEYVRLFVAGRGGVVAAPYESCHVGGRAAVMSGASLAMRDRLAAAGLEVSLDSNEPPDHIALELEYLYHLLSSAWTGGDGALEAEGRAFAGQVMLPWVRRFREALLAGDPHPVYIHCADLTVGLLETVSA